MADTRRGGGEQRGASAQRRAGTRPKVEGDVVMAHADENPKRRAQDQRRGRGEMGPSCSCSCSCAAEYGGTGECGGSNRAVGRETYRGYGEQCGAERAADGKQYRRVVQ